MEKQPKNATFFKFLQFKNPKKLNMKYLGVLLALGVFFMIIGVVLQPDEEPASVPTLQENEKEEKESSQEVFGSSNERPELSSMSDYESFYESELERVLEQVVGINNVTVFVNLDQTEETVYQKNISTREQVTEETDREGGSRQVEDRTNDEDVVIIRNGDKEEPLVVKVKKPSIRGVVVVAEGVENIQVKTWVIEAVSRALDVPSHRVSVLPKNSKGDS
ncbi:stage III sporulation protein AG [Bacillus shivajii]|uniref:stage III sporulation protein AG n=1 Tax=Bacillus shivajii TaxID=1983719 RepID=UPI001CFBD67A|nr:stage III sporulation protein AG [Bacillus shivajii]UCZ54603.1 stage III sporulation protein AG [Bacillus shivajii]